MPSTIEKAHSKDVILKLPVTFSRGQFLIPNCKKKMAKKCLQETIKGICVSLEETGHRGMDRLACDNFKIQRCLEVTSVVRRFPSYPRQFFVTESKCTWTFDLSFPFLEAQT